MITDGAKNSIIIDDKSGRLIDSWAPVIRADTDLLYQQKEEKISFHHGFGYYFGKENNWHAHPDLFSRLL